MRNYDRFYPRAKHDTYRVCVKCKRDYKQWSSTQNSEAWTYCESCAKTDEMFKKKRRRE